MTTVGTPTPRLDLLIRAGAPLDVLVAVLQANGTPADVTGWSARAQVRPGWSSPTVLAELTTTIGAGGVAITATPAQTETWLTSWPSLQEPWDLVLTNPAGVPTPLVAGWALLVPRITRPVS